MADAMLRASTMPTIKCSSCGAEVDLAMMGDHTCPSTATPSTDTYKPGMNHDRLTPSFLDFKPPTLNTPPKESSVLAQSPPPSPPLRPIAAPQDAIPEPSPNLADAPSQTPPSASVEPSPQDPAVAQPAEPQSLLKPPQPSLAPHSLEPPRSPRPKPPPIDSAAANGHRLYSDPLTPSTGNKTAGLSPAYGQPSSRSAGPMLPKPPLTPLSASTSALSFSAHSSRPPSPDGSQTHAFPSSHIPVQRHQTTSKSPITPADPPKSPWLQQDSSTTSDLSRSGTLTRLRRKQSVGADSSTRKGDQGSDKSGLAGLFRRKSSRSMSISKKDISLPEIRGTEVIPPLPQVPPSMMRPTADPAGQGDREAAALPTGPAPRRPARPAEPIDGLLQHFNTKGALTPTLPRSPALPPPPVIERPPRPDQNAPSKRDSDASVYAPEVPPPPERPTLSSNSTGLPQIDEVEDSTSANENENENPDPPPSAWPTGRLRSATRSDHAPPKQPADQGPAPPRPTTSHEMHVQHRHTPSDSASSSGGSRFGFDDRTDSSSISTPPISTMSTFMPWKSSTDSMVGVPSPVTGTPLFESGSQSAAARSANFSRPRAPTLRGASTMVQSPASPAMSVEPFEPEESRASPDRKPSPTASESSQGDGSRDAHNNRAMPRQPPHQPLPGRPGARRPSGSRSQCRGCGEAIVGKSIKASDGRLTGRYHRECFTCKSCKSAFPTADFYVLRDEPYCAYHYHVLNKSLCEHCNRGIEGRYLEVEARRKFHVECFSCHDCLQRLTRGYFEVGGKFYCEVDARRHYQRSGSRLGPGLGAPQRRTTRLMDM